MGRKSRPRTGARSETAGGASRAAGPGTPATAAGRRGSRRRALRAWLVFVAVFAGLLTALLAAAGAVQHGAIRWTARATAFTLRVLGADGRAVDDVVRSSLGPARIIFECTAVFPLMIFLAAVVAYPCPVRPKLYGLLAGVPAILAINQVRLVSLFYVGHWFPSVFDTAHLVVWQSLMIFVTLALWLIWATGLADRRSPRA